jgi:hypothetical protein
MNNKKIEELLKIAEKEKNKLGIRPRKFEHTEDGKLLLDPKKKFDKEWFEDDDAFDMN